MNMSEMGALIASIAVQSWAVFSAISLHALETPERLRGERVASEKKWFSGKDTVKVKMIARTSFGR